MARKRDDGHRRTPTTYRPLWSNALLAASSATLFFVGLAMLLSSGTEAVNAGGRFLGLMLALLFAPLVVRALRAGVSVTDDGVVVPSIFRTPENPVERDRGVQVGGSWSVLPWQTLAVKRTDGTTVTATEVSSLALRHPTVVERTVEALKLPWTPTRDAYDQRDQGCGRGVTTIAVSTRRGPPRRMCRVASV